jgi:serine phosphatase RsbU (regulator of sigma subunit)
MKSISVLLSFVISFQAFAQNPKIDSLLSVLKNETVDSTRIKAGAELGKQWMLIGNYDKAFSANSDAIHLAEQALSTPGISPESRECILKAEGKAYNNIGVTNLYKGYYDKSLESHLKALAIREKIGFKQGISSSLNNIGNLFLQKDELDKAMEWYQRSIKISEEIQDKQLMSMTYNNIGLIYQDKYVYDKALLYIKKALVLREELGDKQTIAASYTNLAILSSIRSDPKTAEEYYFKAIKLMEEVGDKMSMAVTYNNIGDLYLSQHKVAEAKKMQLLSLSLGEEIHAKPSMIYSYSSLAQCDSALGDFKGAYAYQKLYKAVNDSMFNEESDKREQDMQAKYNTEKKQHEIDLLTKDGEIQKSQVRTQKIVIGAVVLGLLFVIAFAFLIFNRLTVTRQQKLIIEDQKRIVEVKNKHITDSINYAKRIQDSILPSREQLSKYFSDYFIFFRPRDIVSGDFYWFSELHEKSKAILVIADCTGHGVPGAFMSMIGNTLLNEIVNEQHIIQPAEILNHLNEGIVKALHQGSRTQDDGMDISICLFDKENSKITFAGANHSMYIANEKTVKEIKGDIHSIGSMFGQKSISFTQKEINIQKNSTMFFFSDGFPDQVGGEKRRKFLTTRMEKLFVSVSALNIKEQERAIAKAFDDWKGKYAQLDDVLLAGIRV